MKDICETILELVRGLIRPTITWLGFGAIIAMLFLEMDIPEWYQAIIVALISYWFAERNARKS